MAGNDTFTVERSAHMAAPPDAVLERIADFRRWRAWSPWEDVDPGLHRTYAGADSGVGAVYEWEGNRKAGKGRMEVTEADAEHVTIDLRFDKPFPSQNTATFQVRPSGTGSEVTWRMVGPKTVMTKVIGIFRPMDRMIGPDFEKGLDRLRADVESG